MRYIPSAPAALLVVTATRSAPLGLPKPSPLAGKAVKANGVRTSTPRSAGLFSAVRCPSATSDALCLEPNSP
jgi:hypothetical protein